MLAGVGKRTGLPGKAGTPNTRKTGHYKESEKECWAKAGAYTDKTIMALENCTLCRGTGWKLVPRADGAEGRVAVACDCGMEDRAPRGMEGPRIPKPYDNSHFKRYSPTL